MKDFKRSKPLFLYAQGFAHQNKVSSGASSLEVKLTQACCNHRLVFCFTWSSLPAEKMWMVVSLYSTEHTLSSYSYGTYVSWVWISCCLTGCPSLPLRWTLSSPPTQAEVEAEVRPVGKGVELHPSEGNHLEPPLLKFRANHFPPHEAD